MGWLVVGGQLSVGGWWWVIGGQSVLDGPYLGGLLFVVDWLVDWLVGWSVGRLVRTTPYHTALYCKNLLYFEIYCIMLH